MPSCAVSEWGQWSTCDHTCGQGIRYRKRDAVGDFANWPMADNILTLRDFARCNFEEICHVEQADDSHVEQADDYDSWYN